MEHSQSAIFLALMAGMAGLSSPASARRAIRFVPPMSFLSHPANTVPELASEVASDATVQARLSRHFHLSKPAMCAYVRHNLTREVLGAPRSFSISFINSQGREYQSVATLPAGTRVFAARGTHQPLLLAGGGNPLTASRLPALLLTPLPGAGGASTGDGQVLFTQSPLTEGEVVSQSLSEASPPPNAPSAPISSLLPSTNRDVPASVPEPGPLLTFAVAVLLLAALGLRRRVS